MMDKFFLTYESGNNIWACIRNYSGQVYYVAGDTFEDWGTGSRDADDYDITCTDKTGSIYMGTFPSGIAAGDYMVQGYIRTGANPADTDFCIGAVEVVWDGSGLVDVFDTAGAGPGAYSHTLTIRTTGGSAVGAGVEVWINTSNVASGSIMSPKFTNSSGQITVNLDYGTYYVFCDSTAYSFATTSNSFTSSEGSTSFNIDIATAVASGGTAYDESFLSRTIASIRKYTDEPSVNAKYTDANLITEIEKSYPMVIAEINRNRRDDIVVARYDVTISSTSSETEYVLPWHIGNIVAIYKTDSNTGAKTFYYSRGRRNPAGRGVWVEGNILKVQIDHIAESSTVTIEYIPKATVRLHDGICTLNAAGTVATLTNSPNQGNLDTHLNAYAGAILRVLEADTNNYMQERAIASYDHTTREATLDAALSPIPSGNIKYEICPYLHRGIDDVMAAKVAWDILLGEGSTKRANAAHIKYQQKIRDARLDAFYSRMDSPPEMTNDNYHNPRRHRRRF
jgi:hypothetical protein